MEGALPEDSSAVQSSSGRPAEVPTHLGARHVLAKVAYVVRQNRGSAIWLVLLAECVIWTILSPHFLTVRNLTNVIRQGSFAGIVAVGGTFVMLTGSIDLTVGSLTAFAGIVAAGVMTRVDNAVLGIAVTIGIGLLSGLTVGVITTRFRVPSFIVTLAGLQILAALTLLFNNGGPIPLHNDLYEWWGVGSVGPIPVPVIVLAAVYAFGWVLLTQTKFGRRTYAVGGNPAAARYAGINVDRHIVSVFVLAGLLTGIGAVLIAGRLATASPLTGQGLELSVVAAIVVGGTSLFGGEGRITGTLAGVLIIAFLQNGLTLVRISSFWQQLAIGLVILLAVVIDRQLKTVST